MTSLQTIRLNPNLEVTRQEIADDAFCVIVDDFLMDPHALIDYACESVDRFLTPELSYPGMMQTLGEPVLRDFHRFVLGRMGEEFSFLRGKSTLETGLTMITFPPEQLSTYQRLCHTDPRDTMGRRKYAALIYLFTDERLGGTAFYRYKRLDVVHQALTLDMQDPDASAAYLAEHTAVFRKSPCYITESNELAELLHVIPARFNRMVFYSGEMAHSAHIASPELLSTDPGKGRLTLNCFASVLPK